MFSAPSRIATITLTLSLAVLSLPVTAAAQGTRASGGVNVIRAVAPATRTVPAQTVQWGAAADGWGSYGYTTWYTPWQGYNYTSPYSAYGYSAYRYSPAYTTWQPYGATTWTSSYPATTTYYSPYTTYYSPDTTYYSPYRTFYSPYPVYTGYYGGYGYCP